MAETMTFDGDALHLLDQRALPAEVRYEVCRTADATARAIKTLVVRGAPAIGVAAAFGMALAAKRATESGEPLGEALEAAHQVLSQSRPTAVNLTWAVSRMVAGLQGISQQRNLAAWRLAAEIAEEDVAQNKAIGLHGLTLIQQQYQQKQFNIMTHCNAGWLATVDFGTALAPIYAAHDAGLHIHVWVSETRPRNQGAALTAWELAQHGVPHTVIADNAAGYLMQNNQVDMLIVGADRVTANGDVCNKIGTYLKALAAFDNIVFNQRVPFYAAVPSPTIDWEITHDNIEIEHRHADEVSHITGLHADGSVQSVRVVPENSNALNPAFDVTPARLVTGIITEKGVFAPSALKELKHA